MYGGGGSTKDKIFLMMMLEQYKRKGVAFRMYLAIVCSGKKAEALPVIYYLG